MEQGRQSEFTGWAVVELFGHQREVGYVTTEVYGAAILFRIDTPELPTREYRLEHPEWVIVDGSSQYVAAGSFVRRDGSPPRTRLVGPGAIYAITPCTEAAARKAIESLTQRKLILLELTERRPLLAGGAEPDENDEPEEDDEPGEDHEDDEEDDEEDGDDEEESAAPSSSEVLRQWREARGEGK